MYRDFRHRSPIPRISRKQEPKKSLLLVFLNVRAVFEYGAHFTHCKRVSVFGCPLEPPSRKDWVFVDAVAMLVKNPNIAHRIGVVLNDSALPVRLRLPVFFRPESLNTRLEVFWVAQVGSSLNNDRRLVFRIRQKWLLLPIVTVGGISVRRHKRAPLPASSVRPIFIGRPRCFFMKGLEALVLPFLDLSPH